MKEIRDMREGEAEEYAEKLRNVRKQHFSDKERLKQIVKIREQKTKEEREQSEELKRTKK